MSPPTIEARAAAPAPPRRHAGPERRGCGAGSPRGAIGGAARLFATFLVGLAAIACGDPTEPGETVFLEGALAPGGSQTHLVVLPSNGVTTLVVEDLKKVLWDVTRGGEDGTLAVTLGVGVASTGECVIGGRVTAREGSRFLWSMKEGAGCFTVADPGLIPAGGTLGYTIRAELPG